MLRFLKWVFIAFAAVFAFAYSLLIRRPDSKNSSTVTAASEGSGRRYRLRYARSFTDRL